MIPDKVRRKVLERDSYDDRPCCAFCGSPYNIDLHHYVERSRFGKDDERNLICLCHEHHMMLHSQDYENMQAFVKAYLSEHYENWNEKELIWSK